MLIQFKTTTFLKEFPEEFKPFGIWAEGVYLGEWLYSSDQNILLAMGEYPDPDLYVMITKAPTRYSWAYIEEFNVKS